MTEATATMEPKASEESEEPEPLAAVVTRDRFKRAVKKQKMVAASKASTPIFGRICLRNEGGRLAVRATDSHVHTTIWLPGQVEGDGAAFLEAAAGKKLAKVLPDAPVEILTDGDSFSLSAGRFNADLLSFEAEEWPRFPTENPKVEFEAVTTVSASLLHHIKRRVTINASGERSRPILNGTYLHERGGTLHAVATDGHVLSLLPTDVPVPEGWSALVPEAIFAHTVRIFDADDDVEIQTAERSSDGYPFINLRSTDAEVGGECIEGKYPKYRQIVPQRSEQTMTVRFAGTELYSALRTLLPLASSQTKRMRFTIEGGAVRISTHQPDVGRSEYTFDAEIDGRMAKDAREIAFNGSYLKRRVLKAIRKRSEVTMRLKTPKRAALFEGTENDVTVLAMPMRLLD